MDELRRVLLVDDDEDLRAVASLSLESMGGLSVRSCASAEEALEAYAGFGPDLVVLDVEMPGIDGPAALESLRVQAGRVPVVFLTARTEPDQVQRLMDLGAVDVIPKPFDPLELSLKLRAIWERIRSRSAPA